MRAVKVTKEKRNFSEIKDNSSRIPVPLSNLKTVAEGNYFIGVCLRRSENEN
jgi:hypothetical protein